MLSHALKACESGTMLHLDRSEQAALIQSLKRRIADLEQMIEGAEDP